MDLVSFFCVAGAGFTVGTLMTIGFFVPQRGLLHDFAGWMTFFGVLYLVATVYVIGPERAALAYVLGIITGGLYSRAIGRHVR